MVAVFIPEVDVNDPRRVDIGLCAQPWQTGLLAAKHGQEDGSERALIAAQGVDGPVAPVEMQGVQVAVGYGADQRRLRNRHRGPHSQPCRRMSRKDRPSPRRRPRVRHTVRTVQRHRSPSRGERPRARRNSQSVAWSVSSWQSVGQASLHPPGQMSSYFGLERGLYEVDFARREFEVDAFLITLAGDHGTRQGQLIVKLGRPVGGDPVLDAGLYIPVSYTHLRAHETGRNLVCRLLLE